MKKFFKILAIIIAGLIVLAYTFDYDYLFKGIAKTYLRGETSATIDDGTLFPSNPIMTGKPKPWIKDSLYNKKKLPASVLKGLTDTETASLLVVKNGKLIHEEYWGEFSEKTKTNSFSMAKGFNVMLLGKAIQEEKIKSLDEKFSVFYDNFVQAENGKTLTLRNLASMESGLNWNEKYKNPFSPNAKLYYGNSLYEASLLKDIKVKPGTKFEYQSGTSQLLGFAIRKAVNEPLANYMSKSFWIPLGMESGAFWNTDENKMEKTFCCVNAIPRDFAKIGQFMLNRGKVDSLQILNEKFIDEMITPTQLSGGIYGMGVWTDYDNPIKYYFFRGLLGQYIIVIPEKNMVIVRTGNDTKQVEKSRGRPELVLQLVNELSNYF